MSNAKTLGCALVLFGYFGFFPSSALGQSGCTPVVYAFRHAEDTNPPNPPGPIFALTATGQAHAALYPAMTSEFGDDSRFCPVTKVYATTKARKVGDCGSECASATNAFDTATPLANSVMAADPITTVGGNQLYEYLGNGNKAPKDPSYMTDTAIALRRELFATARLDQSSAIFWTSQGLHVLGGAIINATSIVPDKNATPPETPPRNAVYIFTFFGSGFSDTVSPSTATVQCFNHVEASSQFKDPPAPKFIDPTGTPPTQLYYCGYNEQSNLGGSPPKSCKPNDDPCGTIPNASTKDIKGKICNTPSVLPNTSGPSIFGACK
jgi:hypothetical protein